jgi:hypothetical protein
MVASLSIRKYTGTNAATESAAVTGVDLSSADNATNSLANRQANPITVATNSYESWLKLKVDAAPTTQVANIQCWGDGAVASSTTLMVKGNQITGVTPTAATSSVAVTSWTNYTAGNKLLWDAGPYTSTNQTSRYLVFQLQVAADRAPGAWTQETVSYSYDET